MNKARKTLFITLLTATLLASCAGQQIPSSTPTADIDAILTESVGTFAAYFYQTQTAMVPSATSTPLNTPTSIASSTPLSLPLPAASSTPIPFFTSIVYPAVTATGTQYTPTVNPSSLASGCNNLGFIRDVTTAPSVLRPGERFQKTWQVANTGTCDWLFAYRLVPVSGTSLAQDPVRVPNAPVPKNEWRQISVTVTAPNNSGTYTQYWQLSDGAGRTFGALLGVTITVREDYP